MFTVKDLFSENTDRILVASLQDGVPSKLAHITARQLPHLGGDAVLLHQRLLGKVELEWVIGRDGDVEAPGQVVVALVYCLNYTWPGSLAEGTGCTPGRGSCC